MQSNTTTVQCNAFFYTADSLIYGGRTCCTSMISVILQYNINIVLTSTSSSEHTLKAAPRTARSPVRSCFSLGLPALGRCFAVFFVDALTFFLV